ncbi:MAG: tetratricopeptide repeat protein [Pirellulales bacterium]
MRCALPGWWWRVGIWLAMGLAAGGVVVGDCHSLPAQTANLQPAEQAAQLLNAAHRAFNEKQLPVAADRFREYGQKFANQPDIQAARYGLGVTLLELQPRDYKAATEALSGPAGAQDFPDRAAALYYLGAAFRSWGHDLLTQAQAKPNEAATLKQTAAHHFAQAAQRFGESHVAWQARPKSPPSAAGQLPAETEWSVRARCDQAEMLLRVDKPKEAGDIVTPLLADASLAPSRYRGLALYLQGYAGFLQRDFATAVRALSGLAPFADPVFGLHAQYLLARTHHQLEERAEAATLYEAVVGGYVKQKAAAQQQLQNAAALVGQADEKARLEELVRTPPEHVVRAQFFWAVLLHEWQKPADALARLTTFLEQHGKSPLAEEARLRQGMCQVELRQFPAALTNLQPLQGHATLADRALLWLARAHLGAADPAQPQPYQQSLNTAAGLLGQAAERAQQRIAQEPEAKARRGEILLELGDCQQSLQQYAQAAGTYELALRDNLAPDRNEEFLQRRATALHLAGQFDAADQVVTQFQQAHPRSPLLPAVLFRGAENAYLRAAAIDPAQVPAKNPDLQKWLTEASLRYKTLVEKFPEFPQVSLARYRWALAQYRLGDLAQAQQLLSQIPSSDYTGELTAAPYYLADCLLRALPSDGADALAAARQLQVLGECGKLLDTFVSGQGNDPAKVAPQTPDALLKLGYVQQRIAQQLADATERGQRLTAARQAFERIGQQFATSPGAPLAAFERANCLIEQNDTGGAQNELSRFRQDPLKGSAVAPLAWLRLGQLLRAQRKSAEAATLLQEARQAYDGALAADPARASWAPLLAYHHALAVKESGKTTDALKLFEAVVQKYAASPEGPEAAWRVGQCRREEALAKLATARGLLAKTDAKPEELAAATRQVDEAVKALNEAGQYLGQQAQAVAAKSAGSTAHQQLLYEAAWCCQAVADVEIEAARRKVSDELLKKRLEEQAKLAGAPAPAATPASGLARVPQQPRPVVAWSAVAVQPAEQAARTHYQHLIAARTDSPLAILARLELAEMLARREDYKAAQALLEEALTLEPATDVEERIRLRLGVTLVALKDSAAALPQFSAVAANAQSPWAAEARYRAGETQMDLQQWAKAIELWLPFRDQGPLQNVAGLSDRVLLRLGHAQALAGQWDASRQTLETLLQRFSQSTLRHDARYGIAWALQNQKQYDQAAQHYLLVTNETAAEVAAKAQYQLALCRVEQRRLPEAATALLVVPFTYDYPEWSATALLEAARVFQEMQQVPQARRLLERVLKDYPDSDWAKAAQQRLTQMQTGGPAAQP